MNSWISSAFSVDTSSSNSVKSNSINTKPKKATRSENKTEEEKICEDVKHTKYLKNKENTFQQARKSSTDVNALKNINNEFSSLFHRYEPTTRTELVVNKAKIDQLSKLLDEILSKSKGSIVVIEGPSGSGKYVI